MPIPLAVLIVEDVESDAQLLVRLLKKADYELVYEQVETAGQMRSALEKRTWDIIISDYSLPQFDGQAALALLKGTGLDIPFIVVSGTIGEEIAVAIMKAGAQDYLMKDNLARLVPAVERELEQAGMRREHRLSQEQLLLQSSALNAAANAIVITDVKGTIEWVNPAFKTLTGYALEEAIGKNPRDLVKSGGHDRSFYKNLWDTILAGEVWHSELINRRKDGSLYTEEETITPLKNADGTISYFIAIKQDITVRKQAEEALRESTSKLETLIRVSPLAIILLDSNEKVQLWNPSAERIFGWTAQEIIGHPNPIVPTGKQDEYRIWSEQVIQGRSLNSQETVRQRKDGSLASVSISSAVVYDSAGNVTGRMAIFEDITERVQAEEALRVSEERYRRLADHAPDIIFRYDILPNMTLAYISPAVESITGYTPQECYADQFLMLNMIHPDDMYLMANYMQSLTPPKEPLFARWIGKDGITRWMESRIVPIRDVDGQLVAVEGITRDISARKQAEQALAASEAELRALVEQVPAIVYTESAETRETLYIGPQVEKLTGYTPAEWIEDRDLWKKMIHPEDLAVLLAEDKRTTADHEPFHIDYRILTRDGRTLWIHDEAVIIKNQDMTPLFWQGVMYDITERRQVEEALLESEEKFAKVFHDAPVWIAISDMANGIYLDVNEESLHVSGFSREEVIGHTATEIEWIKSEDRARLVQEIRDHGHIAGQEMEFHSKDGRLLHGLVNGEQIVIGGRTCLLTVTVDITERKQAEELLRQQGDQLRLLYEVSQRLNRTLDLREIYQVIYDFMSSIAPNNGLIISAFDPETQLITCRAHCLDNNWRDVSSFPSIPLEPEGKDAQSIAIRTGQSMLVNDYQTLMKTDQNSYGVNDETNEVDNKKIPPDEEVIRSALIVPLKMGGAVSGVIQVLSYRLNAYTEDQLKMLEALALHIASAEQNALLYTRVQTELNERKLVEKSLREREEQYRTLVEQLPAVVYIDDANVEGRTLYVSPQIETILGFTPQEWQLKSPGLWSEHVHPDDIKQVHAGYMRCLLYGEPFVAEYRISASDGRLLWFRDQAVMLPDENGKPHLIHGVIYDITERKQAEESMQTTNILLEQTLEQSPIPMALVSMPDGIIRSANSACKHFLGIEDEPSPIGTPLSELKISWQDFDMQGNPATAEDLPLPRSLMGLKSVQERHIVRKDGTSVYGMVYGSPIFDAAGKLIAGYLVMTDITERKQAEEVVRESESKLRKAQHFAHVGSWTWNIKTNQLDWSDEMYNIFGLDKKTFSGHLSDVVAQSIHPDDRYKVEQSNLSAINQAKPIPLEYRVVWADGSEHVVWAEAGEIIFDKFGHPSILSGTVQDISERKYTEEALRISEERYRGLFNSMIDGFALHEIICDANGKPVDYRFLEVNPAFERLTGLQSINLIGKTVLEVLPNTEPYWIEIYGNVALTGNSAFYENYSHELDRYFEVSAYCPRTGQFAVITVDITDRKRAEEDIQQRMAELEMLYQSGLALSQLLNPKEIGQKILELLEEKLGWHHTRIRFYHPQNDRLELLDFNQPGLKNEMERHEVVERFQSLITRSSQGMSGWAVQQGQPVRFGDVSSASRYVEAYPGIRSGLYVPMKLGERIVGVISIESEQPDAFSAEDERLIVTLANQAASAFENARLFEETRQRVTELEMLHQNGMALSRLLHPKEIGQKILELLEEKLNWHHTAICLYDPQDKSLKLLDFKQPGLESEEEKRAIEDNFNVIIAKPGDGMTGWAIQQSQTIRSGDVNSNPHYIETYPGIRSGLYAPMKLGERMIGVIGAESEQPDAFSEADERLIVTLANQASSAFENARLFEETRQRVMELETLNRISLVLRAVSKQEEMLSIVLDEALAILNTSHGSIELYNKTTDCLDQTIMRGWMTQLTAPHPISEGIAGKVFSNAETYITREFASDPETRAAARGQIPPNWGAICLPIRTSLQPLGVLIVCVPSERELNQDEIRLLSTLSEMTGAALQRMQLHEQTVRRLEQLRALRAVDQAISSSRDMHLTLNVLLTHTISQLGVDAADVFLLQPDSNQLDLVANHGFHTLLFENINLSDSVAGRAIIEHRSIMTLDSETVTLRENPQFGKFWKEEGFACYWCMPLSVKGEVKGVLEVYRRIAFTPDAEWLEFLEALAGQAAIAIDNTQLFENLQRANLDLGLAYDATIEGWSRAMDLRDHETEGHTLRVTDLTLKLARAMRVSESQLTAIRRGALLHDIGKMGVPDAILLKEGDLTEDEWVLMRKHPQLARDMLAPIAYLNDALNIPYCHHEKWDGTGYPQGLKGDRIPLVARIFAIVDVWDALTNDRTYRMKWTKQKARQYIKEQSGKHFDPQIVDVFLKNIGKK